MNIYEINSSIQRVLENGFIADPETGEILFDEENLDELEAQFDEKIDSVACYIKDLDALNNAIKDEKKALDERKAVNEKKIEYLKKYIVDALKLRDMKKFESAKNKISFRKSTSVEITNADAIDSKYIVEKVTTSPDKKKIAEDLKAGKEVNGCTLVTKSNVVVK